MSSRELKVLLIEDEENDYIWVRDMLSDITSVRFHLDWISTYEDAVAEICRFQHDVFLLDYRLGVRDGLELLREVMERGCNVPIIFLTGQGDYGVDIEAMKAGAVDYLVKNQINADLLERSIRYSIKGKQMEEDLRASRDELKMRVQELDEKSLNLAEANIALKVMLKHKEDYQKELGETILSNVRNLVLPYLEKLKNTKMSSTQTTLVEILESHFGEITSSFTRTLGIEAADLTPTEMRVAAFIRDGKSSAEIAEILSSSEKTVETHRLRIRKKLGLRSRRSNLRSHLLKLA